MTSSSSLASRFVRPLQQYSAFFLFFFFSFDLSFFLSFFLLTHGKNPFHFKYRKSCAVLLDEFKVALEMYNNPWRLARV